MTLPTEGQSGHLQKHADIDTLIAGHTTQIAAGDVTNPASAAGVALSATIAKSSGYLLDTHPGVDPTGTTECAVAIQSAIDAARTAGQVLISGRSQYKLATGVTIQGDADLSRATFNYTGTTGICLTIGNSVSPASDPVNGGISRKLVRTPYLINLAKTVQGWGQVFQSVGIRVANTADCTVHFGNVRNFGTGIQFRGAGVSGGVTYCKFYVSRLLNNKVNLQVTTDGVSGYANQNQVYGGTFNFDSTEAAASAGTRHILIDSMPSPIDGWTFHDPSLEDSAAVCEFHLDIAGNNNLIDNGRYETSGGTPKVAWRTGSYENEIRGGINIDALIESVAVGTTNRIVRHPGPKVLTASRTLDQSDEGKTIVSNAGAPATYSLPDVTYRSPGTRVTVRNVAASTVTVSTTTDPLDGGFTYSLAQWASKTFVSQHLPDHRWVTA